MEQKKFILLVNKANARIRSLEKHFGSDIWSLKTLRNYLDVEPIQGLTKSGRISKRTYDENTQARVIETINRFLDMQTATVRGVKKQRTQFRSNIENKLSDLYKQPTDKELDTLYNLLQSKAVERIIDKTRIGSDFWVLIQDAKQKAISSEDDLVEYMQQYIDIGNDTQLVRDIKIIYNKYFV